MTQKKELIKKLNQDDILRIILNYFKDNDFSESWACGELLGQVNDNLRFIGIFRNDVENAPFEYDVNKIDREMNFNGDEYPCA